MLLNVTCTSSLSSTSLPARASFPQVNSITYRGNQTQVWEGHLLVHDVLPMWQPEGWHRLMVALAAKFRCPELKGSRALPGLSSLDEHSERIMPCYGNLEIRPS